MLGQCHQRGNSLHRRRTGITPPPLLFHFGGQSQERLLEVVWVKSDRLDVQSNLPSKSSNSVSVQAVQWYSERMETSLSIDVSALDAPHRRALEEVIGRQLMANQRLLISVIDVAVPPSASQRPAQTLEDWTKVYDGLSDEEVEAVDQIAKTRANLTRPLP